MLLPDGFSDDIAAAFYDKTVEKLVKSTTQDSEGGVKKIGTTVASTFKGNVRFDGLREVQSEIGLTQQIDVAITCLPDTAMVIDDLFQYLGVKYVTLDVLPRDSHKLIVGKKWQLQ